MSPAPPPPRGFGRIAAAGVATAGALLVMAGASSAAVRAPGAGCAVGAAVPTASRGALVGAVPGRAGTGVAPAASTGTPPRCALGDGPIRGEYLVDGWGHAYHLFHRDRDPACDACTRFISPTLTGGGVRYDDGRVICNLCRRTAVTRIADVRAVVDEVADSLRALGIDVDIDGMTLHLVGRTEMQRRSGVHASGLRGFTDYAERWRVFGHAFGRRIDLYVLYGMPRMELVSTVAHELMHVWQFNHGRFGGDDVFCEGSCNYAAWRVLHGYRGDEAAFYRRAIETEPDPVYGQGYRAVRRLVETRGMAAWLEALARGDDLPRP